MTQTQLKLVDRVERVKKTQKDLVLEYLLKHGSLTRFESYIEIGVVELASRIGELKADGWEIPSKWITVTARNGRKATIKEYGKPYKKSLHKATKGL